MHVGPKEQAKTLSYHIIVVCTKIEVVKDVAEKIRDKLLERLTKLEYSESQEVPESVVAYEKSVIREWVDFIEYLKAKLSKECSELCRGRLDALSTYSCKSSLEEAALRMVELKPKAPLALRAALLDAVLSLKELEEVMGSTA